MKRARADGSCPHVNVEFTAADYGDALLQHLILHGFTASSGTPPSASHACCACGQVVLHGCGSTAEGDTAGNSLLRGCACGSVMVVDVVRSELYCCSCRDYVYHPAFDEGRQLSHVARRYIDRGLRPGLPHHDPGPDVRAKRARAMKDPLLAVLRVDLATAHAPLNQAAAALRLQDEDGANGGSNVAVDGFPAGLRGLNNLGNTCFMNSVLQVFIHAPLMRNYFLGQGHSQVACSKDTKSPGGPCLSCELDAVFSAAYSGDRAPLSPTDFLYSWWTFADSLAGYRQQDAHEFYLSALSGLSSAMIEESVSARVSTGPGLAPGLVSSPVKEEVASVSPLRGAAAAAPSGKDAGAIGSPTGQSLTGGCASHCNEPPPAVSGVGPACGVQTAEPAGACPEEPAVGSGRGGRSLSLVDAVFGGILRSDVTCSVCGHTSTAYDPFLDISLDMVALGPGPPQLPCVPASRLPQSDTPPASSPTPAHKAAAAEDEETEADGVSLGAAADAARPSGSTCGGRSSLSAMSLPSPSRSRSLSGMTAAAVAVEEQEQGEGELDEAHQGRSQGGCASPSTGSGSVPNEGQPHPRRGREAAAAAGRESKLQSNGASTASDDSCGPARGLPEVAGAGAAAAQPRRPTGPPDAAAAAAPTAVRVGGHAAGATAEAATGPARSSSDSMAAAESAADGGGGGTGEAAASPDDCITSPQGATSSQLQPGPEYRLQALNGPSPGGVDAGGAAMAVEQLSDPQASAAAAAPAAGRCRSDLGSRGLTPGASASCAEDVTEAGPPERDEDTEAPSTQPSPSPPDSQAGRPVGGRRGGGAGGAGGRAPRGRGRGGGRGRGRGAAGGRGAQGGRGGGGGTVPQMGHAGASVAQMADPRLTRRPGTAEADAGQAIGAGGHATLHGCLRHFITPERLSASESWVCSACQRRQPAVKQLSIRRLPPVLALHVKRFEQRHHHHHHQHPPRDVGAAQVAALGMAAGGHAHGGGAVAAAAPTRPGRHAARKIQTQLQFPVALDLAPYTTPAILRDRYCMRGGDTAAAAGGGAQVPMMGFTQPSSGDEARAGAAVSVKLEPGSCDAAAAGSGGGGDSGQLVVPSPSAAYQLFAVISHKGDLSGGHYVVFVRPGGAAGCGWYQCDDAWVTAVSEEDVTACQAYMLFYSAEL